MNERTEVRRALLRLAVAGAGTALAHRALGSQASSPGSPATPSPSNRTTGSAPGAGSGDRGAEHDPIAPPTTPRWLGTARFANGDFRAVALDADGRPLAERRLPERAHGVAVHPGRGIGCVFARRPGKWLCTFDLGDLGAARFVDAPPARRFSGHGTYSRDGRRLYTTENDIERQRGVVGVHDTTNGYRRIGEFDSHGVGPHEIVRPAGTELLVLANGGIATHPDHGDGRLPLNLGQMRPDIVVLDARDGRLLSRHVLPDEHHRISLRHLAVDSRRRVWFAAQLARDPREPDIASSGMPLDGAGASGAIVPAAPLPLAGSFALTSRHARHRTAGDTHPLEVLSLPPERVPQRHAYLSSVASNGADVLYTAARDGIAFRVDARRGELVETIALPDCSGVAGDGEGFVVSSGLGELVRWDRFGVAPLSLANWAWDNHLHGASSD